MSILTDKDVQTIVEATEGLRNFNGYQLTKKEHASGYQGDHWRLTVSSDRRDYTFHVKSKPKGGEAVSKLFESQKSFDKEGAVYGKVFKSMRKYCVFKLWPEIFLIKDTEVLVMEDLTSKGWKVSESLDECHLKVALKSFAAFHAASLAMEFKGITIESLAPILLQETMFNEDDDVNPWKGYIRASERIVETYIPGVGREVLRPLLEMKKFVGPSTDFRNCLIHFDPWRSNLLFKYINGKPVGAVFIDFGSCRYAPPILDVLLFLRIADASKISSHVDYYFANLNNFLSALRTPLLTRDELLASHNVYTTPAVCIAPVYTYLTRLPVSQSSVILSKPEEFVRFASGDNVELAIQALREDASYRVAVIEVMCRMIQHLRRLNSS